MAETLGTGEVLVTANVDAALASIERLSAALDALSNKADLVMRGQSMPGGVPGAKPTPRELNEVTISPQLKGELSNIPITIDASDIASQIQSALNDYGAFAIRVELDTVDIQKQFNNMRLEGPRQGSVAGAAAPPEIKVSSAGLREVNTASTNAAKLGTAIESASQLVRAITGKTLKPAGDTNADIAQFFVRAGQVMGHSPGDSFARNRQNSAPFRKSTQSIVDAAVAGGMDPAEARMLVNESAGITSRVLKRSSMSQPAPAVATQAPPSPPPPPAPLIPPPITQNITQANRQAEQAEQVRQAGWERLGSDWQMREAAAAVEVKSYSIEDIVAGIGPARQRAGPGLTEIDRDPISGFVGGTKRRSAGSRPMSGPVTLDGLDVTDIAERLGRGAFHGMSEVTDTGRLVGRARDPERGTFIDTNTANVEGTQRRVRPIQPREALRRALQIRRGGEVTNDELDEWLEQGDEGKTAPIAGASTGRLAPFMKQGGVAHRTAGPLPGGHQGFMTPQMDALTRVAKDQLAATGGNATPIGSAPQSPDLFMSVEQSADYRQGTLMANRQARHNQLKAQMRSGLPAGLTSDQLGAVLGERAGQENLGEVGDQAMSDLATLFDALLDPSLLPTEAMETIGRFHGPDLDEEGNRKIDPETGKSSRGSGLTTYQAIEYRMNQIMEATGLAAALGIDQPSVTMTGLAKQLGSRQGGQLPSRMLLAIRDKRFAQSNMEQAAGDQVSATENAAITRDANKSILERTPTMASVSRRQVMEHELGELTGEGGKFTGSTDSDGHAINAEKRILARSRGRNAKAAMSQAMEDNHLEPGSLGRVSRGARAAVEARVDEIIEEMARPELVAAATRQAELEASISKERQVERVSMALADSLSGATEPMTESALLAAAEGIADPAGEALAAGVLEQAAKDVFKAQGGPSRRRPPGRTVGTAYDSPEQRQGLERGARSTHDVGGQLSHLDADGNVVPNVSHKRTDATRVGPGSSESLLITPDETVARAAAHAGKLPPSIVAQLAEERKRAAIEDAVNVASGIDSNAGIMVVTIASPIPLPVIIVGGGSGGGGGNGGKPPTKTGSGGGGDDGDDEKMSPAEARKLDAEGRPHGRQGLLAQDAMAEREASLKAQMRDEEALGQQAALAEPPAKRHARVDLSLHDTYEEAKTERDRLSGQFGDDDNEYAVSRRADGFRVTLRKVAERHSRDTAAAAEVLGKGGPAGEIANQREFDAQTRAADTAARNQNRARKSNEDRLALQQQRREDPLGEAARQAFSEIPGNDAPPVGPLTADQQRSFDEQYTKLRTTAGRREADAKRQAEAKSGQKGPGLAQAAPSRERLDRLVRTAGERLEQLEPNNPLGAELSEGLPNQEFDPESVLRTGDPVLKAQREARASLRQARGRIPQRALSTSIVQISENLFGGLEKPLEKIAMAEQEFGQLGDIGRRVGANKTDQAIVQRERETAVKTRDSGIFDPSSQEGKELTASIADFDAQLEALTKTGRTLLDVQTDQVKKVKELASSAVGTSDILRNLGAGFIGAIGGQLVTQVVSLVAGAMDPIIKLITPEVDKMLGSGITAQRVQAEAAQRFTQSGFSQSDLLSSFGAQGFGVEESMRLQDVIGGSAGAISGAEQIQQRIDTNRAARAIEGQGEAANLQPGDASLFRGSDAQLSLELPNALFPGGTNFFGKELDFLDIGGSDSAAKTLGRMIEDIEPDVLPTLIEQLQNQGPSVSKENTELATFNKGFGDSGVKAVPGKLEGDTLKILRSVQGTGDMINSLTGQGLTLEGITSKQDVVNAVREQGTPRRDFMTEATARGSSVEFQNEMWLFGQERDRALQAQQFGVGLQGASAPLLPGGTGIPGGGSDQFQRQFAKIAGPIHEAEAAGMAMVEALTPGSVLDEYNMLGDLLEDLGVKAGKIEARQQMRAYAISVDQASIAVQDLTAITGEGIGSNIGMMERENMLMQRRLQTLQFEQQQRGINFGVAIAGFQTEGLTGAERGARLKVAKEEAKIQQEMLNLSKGIFGNQVQIVDQRNLQQLRLATANLDNIVKSFRENNSLKEFSQLAAASGRRQKQLEIDISHNLQTQLQLASMADKFSAELNTYSQRLVTAGKNYREGTKIFRDSVKDVLPLVKLLGEWVGDDKPKPPKNHASPNQNNGSIEDQTEKLSPILNQNVTASIGEQTANLSSMVSSKNSADSVGGSTIVVAPRITGTVVNYKELVDLIVEELGKQGVRTGQNS